VEAKGSDDPRNGLVFCLNHHRAFDLGLFRIHPQSLQIQPGPAKQDLRELLIQVGSISHLPARPHPEALKWAWRRSEFEEQAVQSESGPEAVHLEDE
jgi:hypothetical protein